MEGSGGNQKLVRGIVGLLVLLSGVVVLLLALKKPIPVAEPQSQDDLAANAESFQQKVGELAQSQSQPQDQPASEIHLTSDEVAAALTQASSASAASAQDTHTTAPGASTDSPEALANATVEGATLHDPAITFEGDVVRGQFATEVSGKTFYITVAGHLGSRDGYATFEPTEFKIGDLSVPVSLVNPALQKKMQEQRDRMKLPEFISDIRVENGELVVKPK
jgi:hypothetical protein